MKITWLGHACFKIESKDTIIIDPFKDSYVDGLKNIREEANICICSHNHSDHNAKENIKIIPKHLECSYTYIETFHDDKKGALRGNNKITIIHDGNYKMAHLGDLGCDLEVDQLKLLENLDVLMIPIGGYYTINSKQAFEFIQKIQPKHIIPMHYKSDTFGYDVLENLDNFISYFDDISIHPSNSIDVDSMQHLLEILTY